jgi:hypothetical protein
VGYSLPGGAESDDGLPIGMDEVAQLSTRQGLGRGSNQPIILHAQHRDPGRHFFGSAIGLEPLQSLAGHPRLGATTCRMLGNQAADLGEFFGAEVATGLAVAQEVSGVAGDKPAGGGRASSSRRVWPIDQGNQGVMSAGGLPPFSAQVVR